MAYIKTIAAALLLTVLAATAVDAAPVAVTLQRTSGLFNEDPPGAPAPLARTQWDAGDVFLNGVKVAEYVRSKDVTPTSLNAAAVRLTFFIANPGGAPIPITFQGSHSFDNGREMGSVSASSLPTVPVGVSFTSVISGGVETLTLNLP